MLLVLLLPHFFVTRETSSFALLLYAIWFWFYFVVLHTVRTAFNPTITNPNKVLINCVRKKNKITTTTIVTIKKRENKANEQEEDEVKVLFIIVVVVVVISSFSRTILTTKTGEEKHKNVNDVVVVVHNETNQNKTKQKNNIGLVRRNNFITRVGFYISGLFIALLFSKIFPIKITTLLHAFDAIVETLLPL